MDEFDSSSPRPLYLQLADSRRRDIETCILQPGERLLPELETAKKYGLSRGTARQALELLVHQKLIQRTAGKGTLIATAQPPPNSLISI